MESVVDFFLEFLEKNASYFGNNYVSLMPLKEYALTHTPIAIPYSDCPTNFTDMAGMVILNFSKYCDERYPIHGLHSIKNIVTKNMDENDTKIQITVMLHLTKLKLPIRQSVHLFASAGEITMDVQETSQLTNWRNVSLKVLAHTQVNETINRLMKDTFGMDYCQRIKETEQTQVSVEFVETNALELRGFAGINCIYINQQHFKMRMLQLSRELSSVDKENAALMDIATVAIHEYAHVRVRQIMNDLNMSTPNFIAATANVSDPEFGRMAEREFFTLPIDWPQSLQRNGVPKTYIQSFLQAIETNSDLPVPLESQNLVERESRKIYGGDGVDLYFLNEFC